MNYLNVWACVIPLYIPQSNDPSVLHMRWKLNIYWVEWQVIKQYPTSMYLSVFIYLATTVYQAQDAHPHGVSLSVWEMTSEGRAQGCCFKR